MQYPKNFEIINRFTQKWEKGYVNHPNDPGGATYNGISLRFLKDVGVDVNKDGHVNAQDIRDMYLNKRQDLVDELFWKAFWRDARLDEVEELPIQAALFDCGVNTGRTRSVKCLQQGINSMIAKGDLNIKMLDVDGKRGAITNEAISLVLGTKLVKKVALSAIDARIKFHTALCDNSPYPDGRDYRPFRDGWLNRCNDLKYNIENDFVNFRL